MTARSDLNDIIFSFEGNIADEHELSFYEAARFQYAAARLVYKLEHFRQTGRILERVSEKIDADIRISTAKKGSWELAVSLASLPIVASCTLNVPLNSMFAYILNYIKPKSKGNDLALQLAKIEYAKEKERTKQSQEETKRMQVLEKVIEQKMASPKDALIIVKKYNYPEIESLQPGIVEDQEEVDFIKSELAAEQEYEKQIAPYESLLNEIPAEQIYRLADMFRKSSKELAYPLRTSANKLSISSAPNSNVCVFNRYSLESMAEEIQDNTPTYLEGSIKMYDKETGWGKFRNNEQFNKPIPFVVPAGIKKSTLAKISKALASPVMGGSFYIVRNSTKQPIRLVLDTVVEEKIDNISPLSQ